MGRGPSEPREQPAVRRGEPALQPFDLLRALKKHNVEFIVIGGFAVAVHGHVRATKDVDVVPEASLANLKRLMDALRELDAQPLIADDFDKNESPVPFNLEGLRGGGNWLLRTSFGRLDIMQYASGMPEYDQLRDAAVVSELPQLPENTLICGYDDLVAMKAAAGRDQDQLDLDALRRARGEA